MLKKIYHIIKPVIRNYYLITGIVFAVWMIFFDSNNIITQYRNRRELKQLMQEKDRYESEIARNKAIVQKLTDPADKRALEKFARENYHMKRPNEEIFLIIKDTSGK